MSAQNANIELVIAVLRGSDIQGDGMKYIMDQLSLTEVMTEMLGGSKSNKAKELVLTPVERESLINGIVEDIDDSIEDIVDAEFSLNGNYIEIDSYDVSSYKLTQIIENALDVYITVQEPDNAL